MITRRALLAIACGLTAGLFGCSSSSTSTMPTAPPTVTAMYAANFHGPPNLARISLPFSSSSTVTTISPASLANQADVAFDSAGNLYVSGQGATVSVFA
ncbi:MAG TPA: hypothetical protein VK216_00420, partial [Magnetospirillaceae bacterium]|nr:hypothetical protein [Magnetospirillaceae bacterium]